MNRRDLLIGTLGSALGLSGCNARSASRALSKTVAHQSFEHSPEVRKQMAKEKARKRVLQDFFPALSQYVESLEPIPAGSFLFNYYTEHPDESYRVNLSAFRMGAYPVTCAMWKEYCKHVGLPYSVPEKYDNDEHPVTWISYDDIVGENADRGFCHWATEMCGLKLSLPTGMQYEYACRGGSDGFDYPWGNEFDWERVWVNTSQIAPVNRTNRNYMNPYGLTDMIGNVMQICSSDYKGGKELRGASFYEDDPENCMCASQSVVDRDKGFLYGFRLISDID